MKATIQFLFTTLVITIISSCKNHCALETFYNTYKSQYSKGNSLSEDLQLKKIIFSKLCLSNSSDKFLMVESELSTESWYSHGLIFCFDDSSLFYYKVENEKIECGKGDGAITDLQKVLNKVKVDFDVNGAIMDSIAKSHQLSDASFYRLSLFDKSRKPILKKFAFNSPFF